MKEKIIFILAIVAILGGAFYWYEWRPVKIKHDCSWVKKHSDAVPAKPAYNGKTQKEIDECKAQAVLSAENDSNKIRLYPEGHECEINSAPTPAEPAQPAKDWLESATKNQYDFCIHEKGL